MAKEHKTKYVCGECGYESVKWLGQCPGCGNWNTLTEETVISARAPRGAARQAQKLSDVSMTRFARVSTGMSELDRVLGGGLVPGMAVLLGGDPGIGKSTLLLQAADALAEQESVLYVTGEESAAQVRQRAARLHVTNDLMLYAQTDVSEIDAEARRLKSRCVIVDSVQTVFDPELSGVPGSVGQVREAAAVFTRLAKETGAVVWLVGHVTKDGAIAGPRVLEHMVDTVLYFEGDRQADLRLLRAVKNRFGPTNEVGVFEMSDSGMRQVEDPSRLFLTGARLPGSAITCAMEGTRPMLAEVQALTTKSAFASPKRMAAGIDGGRLSLLLAVLEKKAHLALYDQDVYLNVVGGLRLYERAPDAAVALCVASCLRDAALPAHTAAIGEIGLTGEVRAVSQMERRVNECVRLGFTRVIVPKGSVRGVKGAKLVEVSGVGEMIVRAFEE